MFGRPRDIASGNALLSSWQGVTKGYTDHEHLNEQELIHMNGRIYDFNIGRFLSVDPFLQFPENSQSANPYSYILNNPMSGVDPTGYSAQKKDEVDPEPDEKGKEPIVSCSSSASKAQCRADNNRKSKNDAINNYMSKVLNGQSNERKGNSSTNQSGDAERTWGSYLPGTQTGDESAQFWANRLVAAGGGFTDDPVASTGLFFSSLLTPNTAADTSFALFGGELFALGGKAFSYAGSKIIGNAQSTGTLGHATISKIYTYAYAMNPNVTKVTMDLGYKRLMDGVKSMRLKYGPRPDIAARYKDGSVKVKEIASKTDKPTQLIQRNANKMRNEGISGSVSVNNWAVQLQKWFGK